MVLIEKVLDSDMCIACGACIPTCTSNNIIPTYHEGRGAHEVKLLNSNACEGCDSACESVCPSISVDYTKLIKEEIDDYRLGPIKNTYVGNSIKYQKDNRSSSGGIVRELVEYYLRNGFRVLSLLEKESEYRLGIINSIEEMKFMPGSIYHSVSYTDAINYIRSAKEPIVIVAIPCQLEGVMNYIDKIDQSLKEKIEFKIGIICGWMYSDHSIELFSKLSKVKGEILNVSYRGEDEVGKLKIKTTEGEYKFDRRSWSGLKEWLTYSASFSREANRFRCRVCQNHLNTLADISVGDAWLERERGNKVSVIASRSNTSEGILKELTTENRINLDATDPNDLIESQSYDLVYGVTASKIESALKRYGAFHPDFEFGDVDKMDGMERHSIRFELLRRKLFRSDFKIVYVAMYVLSKCNVIFKRIYGKLK